MGRAQEAVLVKSNAYGAREAALRALYDMEQNAAYGGAVVRRYLKRGGYKSDEGGAYVNGDADGDIGGTHVFGDDGGAYVHSDDGNGDEYIHGDEYGEDDAGVGAESAPDMRVDAREQALTRELTYGVTKWKLTLDSIIFQYSKLKKTKIAPLILIILRLGVYQIVFLSKIPAFAACDECVKLAKKYGNKGSVAFVNALLRKIAANSAALTASTIRPAPETTAAPAESNAPDAADAPAELNAPDTADAPADSNTLVEAAAPAELYTPGTAAAPDKQHVPNKQASPDKNYAQYLSVRHSYPLWLCEKWLRRYGPEFASAYMDAGNRKPELTLRVNTARTTAAGLMDRLNARGFDVVPGRYSKNALILRNPSGFTDTAEFRQGLFSVQGESSMLCAEALDPRAHESILDVCAAPGGKCAYAAELTDGAARILATDINARRLSLMEQNFTRLGLTSIKTALADATARGAAPAASMDKVLLDAPCSGLGVIAKKPDIKWSVTSESIAALSSLQKAMLRAAAGYVKPGGALVYGVCTAEPEECEDVINGFLRESADFEPDDLRKYLPAPLWENNACGGGDGLYIFPHMHGIDGFYIARIIRKTGV